MKFGLENVRCFAKLTSVRIAPLTILVGENSTGKSSFLALLRIANQIFQGDLSPDFNAEPFKLGAYEQIAHHGAGQGSAESFTLSLSIEVPSLAQQNSQVDFQTKFIQRDGQPDLIQLTVSALDFRWTLEPKPDSQEEYRLRFDSISDNGAPQSHSTFIPRRLMLKGVLPPGLGFFYWLSGYTTEEESSTFRDFYYEALEETKNDIYPFAPVRTKPLRTYDPVTDNPQVEGAHVPSRLVRMQRAKDSEAQALQAQISEFGKVSGLFDSLEIKELGLSQSDPFQILVKVGETSTNLIDVGYGVSQVLPILVDLLDGANASRRYLLQQPEVHLHPRAQAQLGSFLGQIVTRTQNHVVVETHSDYLIDRVRMAIREEDNELTSDSVSLLYFEHTGSGVEIHEIKLDGAGDIIDPPQSYRHFFMSELSRKFGV